MKYKIRFGLSKLKLVTSNLSIAQSPKIISKSFLRLFHEKEKYQEKQEQENKKIKQSKVAFRGARRVPLLFQPSYLAQ